MPRGNARIRVSQKRVEWHGNSAGDAISAEGATHLWIDHCHFESTVDKEEDKLIVIKKGSKAVTISNNVFRNQDKVQHTAQDVCWLARDPDSSIPSCMLGMCRTVCTCTVTPAVCTLDMFVPHENSGGYPQVVHSTVCAGRML